MASATYHTFGKSLPELLLAPSAILLAAVSVLSITWGRNRPLSSLRTVPLIAAWCDAAVMLYQEEGFGNHYYPLPVLAILMLTTLVVDGVRVVSPSAPGRVAAYFMLPAIMLVGIAQGTERRVLPNNISTAAREPRS